MGKVMEQLKGLQHVSIFTADSVTNFEFYTKKLSMRLVKKTVNQDNTSSYHMFYGDERGNLRTQFTFLIYLMLHKHTVV
jgi:glyoxalase family protein